MRRKPDAILPIECDILQAAAELQRLGSQEFHGFDIAKKLRDIKDARLLTGYGTLYKALSRLQDRGLLQSRWETLPPDENRPRHRYYQITSAGEAIAAAIRAGAPTPQRCTDLNLGGVARMMERLLYLALGTIFGVVLKTYALPVVLSLAKLRSRALGASSGIIRESFSDRTS